MGTDRKKKKIHKGYSVASVIQSVDCGGIGECFALFDPWFNNFFASVNSFFHFSVAMTP